MLFCQTLWYGVKIAGSSYLIRRVGKISPGSGRDWISVSSTLVSYLLESGEGKEVVISKADPPYRIHFSKL
jgi:hypothetical protein